MFVHVCTYSAGLSRALFEIRLSVKISGPEPLDVRGTPGSPRFPVKGCLKGDIDIGVDIDVDIDIGLNALWGLSKSA